MLGCEKRIILSCRFVVIVLKLDTLGSLTFLDTSLFINSKKKKKIFKILGRVLLSYWSQLMMFLKTLQIFLTSDQTVEWIKNIKLIIWQFLGYVPQKKLWQTKNLIFNHLTFVQEAYIGYVRRSRSSTPFLLFSTDLSH